MSPVELQQPDAFGIGHLFWLTSDAIVAASLDDQRIVLWNPGATRLFGYEADEAVGMALERLVPDDLRAAHLDGIGRYARTGRGDLVGAAAAEVAALTRTGERRDVSLSLTDLSVPTGDRVVLAIIRDVTAEKEARREIERLNTAMREFVAAIAHDLRSPLTTIRGFAGLLTSAALPETRRPEMIETIRRNAENGLRLVEDLLLLSRIESAAVRTEPAPLPVAELAAAVVTATGVDAEVRVPDDVLVLADVDHVQRILTNLLVNASRHGAPPFLVDHQSDGAEVRLRVSDSGSGVPERSVDGLFVPFSPLSDVRAGGTGLGLSIVRGLARANGGDAFYERIDGRTSFGVMLPAAVAGAA